MTGILSGGHYLIQYATQIIVRHGVDALSAPAQLVQEGQRMYGLIQSARQTTEEDDLVLLENESHAVRYRWTDKSESPTDPLSLHHLLF